MPTLLNSLLEKSAPAPEGLALPVSLTDFEVNQTPGLPASDKSEDGEAFYVAPAVQTVTPGVPVTLFLSREVPPKAKDNDEASVTNLMPGQSAIAERAAERVEQRLDALRKPAMELHRALSPEIRPQARPNRASLKTAHAKKPVHRPPLTRSVPHKFLAQTIRHVLEQEAVKLVPALGLPLAVVDMALNNRENKAVANNRRMLNLIHSLQDNTAPCPAKSAKPDLDADTTPAPKANLYPELLKLALAA